MADSVGSLLAAIAVLLADGMRILDLADKRHWGLDEFEQRRALDEALDEAKKDFQELAPLVHGQMHYELDRRHESLDELRCLRDRCRHLVSALKDWTRSGGPIDAVWVLDTQKLQRDLHRAQCRAARRIFTSDRESTSRCLGAYLVRRRAGVAEAAAACETVGGFERFGDTDVVFICDFCDGHLLWGDVEAVPLPAVVSPVSWTTTSSMTSSMTTTSTALSKATTTTVPPPTPETWHLPALTASTASPHRVVSPVVAIANHVPPAHGDWLARLLCPFCEDEARRPHDDDDDDEADAFRDVDVDDFDDLLALHQHMEAYHSAADSGSGSCVVM